MVSLDAAVEGAPAHPINITICQVDVRSPPFDLSTFDMVVTISFEHILEDIKVIQMLSVGTQFIFGVATFRHPEHHRHFTSAAAVHKRYCSLLNITAVYQVTGTRIDNTKVVAAGIRSAFSTCDFRADHADWNTWGKGKGDQNTAVQQRFAAPVDLRSWIDLSQIFRRTVKPHRWYDRRALGGLRDWSVLLSNLRGPAAGTCRRGRPPRRRGRPSRRRRSACRRRGRASRGAARRRSRRSGRA